eukprot:Sro114_g056230.2  (665) ;mRNA; f:14108-16102
MIVVTIHDNNNNGLVLDSQCLMLRFVFPSSAITDHRRLFLVRYDEDAAAHNEDASAQDDAEMRILPRAVRLLDANEEMSESSRDVTRLTLQLVEDSDGDDNSYSGFILRNCFNRIVCTESFSEVLVGGADKSVRMQCLHAIGCTSDDIKCNATLMGQGTASVMCPCTICVAKKKDFASYLTKPREEQPSNREGDYANPKMYKAFMAEAKGRAEWVRLNSTGQARTLKIKYCSVTHEPLLYTPPSMNTCSGMHVSSGLLTHLTVKMLDLMGEIDKTTTWMIELPAKLDEAKEFIKSATASTDKLRKQDAKLVRDIFAARGMARPGCAQMITQLEADRDEIASMLTASTKARDAAKLFTEKGAEFLAGAAKKSKTRILGPATYCFRKTYEVDGRVPFRVENSGFELSNADGIKVLERIDKIDERMKRVFDNPQMQASIDHLMNKFVKMARLLYRMSVMMKSQKKWSTENCDQFESTSKEYAMLWLELSGEGDTQSNNPAIFNKLHVLVTHVPQFVRRHRMLGRCSEEGFESSHKCIESVRKPLKCMTSTEDRANTIYRRILLQSRPEIERTFESINNHYRNNKRGPYNKDPSKMKTADAAKAAREVGCSLSLPEGFLPSINGYVVKESWKDEFEYVCFSKVPQSWSKTFTNDERLGEGCRTTTEYL